MCWTFTEARSSTHSLCLKFFYFFDQAPLISEASFYFKDESDHITFAVHSLVNKILDIKRVQVNLQPQTKQSKAFANGSSRIGF